MSLITLPNTFSAGTTAIASQVNANFVAISNVVNGNLDQTNLGTFSGAVNWTIVSNVLAQSVSSSSTTGLVSLSATGVFAGGVSGLSLTSSANQTKGQSG